MTLTPHPASPPPDCDHTIDHPDVGAPDRAVLAGHERRRWYALGFIATGNLLVFGGVTIMNVALPAAQADLGLGVSTRQWVITIYAVMFGSLILLGGRVGDGVGLRRTTVIGLSGYAVASLLGALAPSGAVLLAARATQGAAGAAVAACALALLSRTFPSGSDRERAFGVLGIVMGFGGAGAFVVGGALTEVSWRWCLAIATPIAVVTAIGLHRTAVPDAPAIKRRVDVAGAVLATSAIGALIVGFDRAAATGWTPWPTITALATGALALLAFVLVEHRTPAPLLPLRLFTDRVRSAAYLSVFLLGIAVFAGFLLLTFHLQNVLGWSPLVTGLAFVPFGAAAVASSKLIGPALRRWPAAWLFVAGLAMTAGGAAYLTRLDADTGYLVGVVPAFVLFGLGATTVMVSASNRATLDAGEDTGVASATVGASQQIGAALGTGLLGSIAVAATSRFEQANALAPGDLTAQVHGLTRASAVGAIIVATGTVAVIALGRRSR